MVWFNGQLNTLDVISEMTGFPLYFGIKIQGLSRTLKLLFQGPILHGSMDIITAIFNIYFCDYGTVLVDKNKT